MSIDIETIGLGFDTSEVSAGIRVLGEAEQAANKTANAADRLSDRTNELSRQNAAMAQTSKAVAAASKDHSYAAQVLADRMLAEADAADKFMAKLQQQASQIGKTKAEVLAMQAAMHGVSEGAAPLIAQIDAATSSVHKNAEAMEKGAFATVGARRELIVLGHEAVSGNFSKMPGSFMVLAERMELTASMLGPVALGLAAVVAVGAGLGLMVAHAESMQRALNSLQTELTATGRGSMFTTDQLKGMVEQMALMPGVTKASAEASLSQFAKTHQIGQQLFSELSMLVADFAAATGTKAPAAAKALAEAFSDPERGAQMMEKTFGTLTAAQLVQIDTMMKHNDMAGAQRVLLEALHGTIDGLATKGLTPLQKASNDLGIAWDGLLKSFGESSALHTVNGLLVNIVKSISWVADHPSALAVAFAGVPGVGPLAISTLGGKSSAKNPVASGKVGGQAAEYVASQDPTSAQSLEDRTKAALALGKSFESVSAAQDRMKGIADALKKSIAENTSEYGAQDEVVKKLKGQLAGVQEAMGRKGSTSAVRDGINAEIEELKRGDLLVQEQAKQKVKNIESQYKQGLISHIDAIHQETAVELEAISQRKGFLGQELESAQKKKASLTEQARIRGDMAKLDLVASGVIQNDANREAEAIQKAADEARKAYDKDIAQQNTTIAKINEQANAFEFEMANRDKLKEAIQAVAITRLQEQAAVLAGFDGSEEKIRLINDEIAARKRLLGDMSAKDIQAYLDPVKAQSFGDALKNSFGEAGAALGKLSDALQHYGRQQIEMAQEMAKVALIPAEDARIKAEMGLAQKQAAQQIHAYGDMAGAAKGFFKENSAGYKTLHATEQAFRLYELTIAAESMVKKVFYKEAEVAATQTLNATKLTGEATTSAASTALAGTEASAWGITAVVKSLASLPFPFNLAAGAATLAAVVAIGAKMFGGVGGSSSGVDVAKERQAAQGTGTVLGDDSAKSESLAHSMELLSQNSNVALKYSSQMLASLRSINDGIAGMASFVAQSSGLRGTAADGRALGVGASKGPLGFSSSSTELVDTGIVFDRIQTAADRAINAAKTGTYTDDWQQAGEDGGWLSKTFHAPTMQTSAQTIGTVLSDGVSARGYSDLHKESSSWWGLSKSSSDDTVLSDLDARLKRQMALTIGSLYSGVLDAGVSLGKDRKAMEGILNDITLESAGLTKISLKGLSGADVEKELQAVFSAVGDTMAEKVIPGFKDFQKVGEGYFETVVRAATGMENAQFQLEQFGIAAGALGDLVNKQGDIATELVRQAIGGTEMLNGVFNGIGDIISTLDGSAADLADTYKSLLDVREALAGVGITGDVVTRDLIRGARDIGSLQSGTQAYFDNYFSEAEKAAIKTQQMSERFRALGMAMPDDKDGFRALVKGIDTTTASGQRLLGQLLGLADGFSEVSTAALDAMNKVIDDAFSALQGVLDQERSIAAKTVQDLTALFNLLKTNVAELYGQVSSTSQMLAAQGQAFIAIALAKAQAGGALPETGQLSDAIAAARGGLGDDKFKTKADQDFAKLVLAGQLSQLKDITGPQLTAAELELQRLDKLLAISKEQLDELRGIKAGGLTESEALNAFLSAISGQKSGGSAGKGGATTGSTAAKSASGATFGTGSAPTGSGRPAWQSLSNGLQYALRDGDTSVISSAAGTIMFTDFRQFVSDNLNPEFLYKRLHVELGMTEQDIAKGLHQPDTSIVRDFFGKAGIPAFIGGGDHLGGARLVGEGGPELEVTGPSRIFNASQTREILSGGGSGDIAAVVNELKGLRDEMRAAVGFCMRSARVLERARDLSGTDALATVEVTP